MKDLRNTKHERGSAFIEAAIALPIFFTLIFGIIDFSRLMWADANITNALADAARSAEVLDLRTHENREEVARALIQSLKRYKTSVGSLYCKPSDGNACPQGSAANPAKIRMEWIEDTGNGLYDAIQNSLTVKQFFYQEDAEKQSPVFDNTGRSRAIYLDPAVQPRGFIGLSVMFRPNCLICKYLLGREVQFRRSIFVPYSRDENPFADAADHCHAPLRTCFVNPEDGTLVADVGIHACGTCPPDSNF